MNATTVTAHPKKSTTVRFSLPLQRFGLRALCLLAPGTAAEMAVKLFSTPPRHSPPEAERDFLATGHRAEFTFNGLKMATWSWGNGPTVYLVHGWGGRSGQWRAFVPALLAEGYSVVLFDGPAHGQSEGKRATLVDFAESLSELVRWGGGAYALIGHSMGGAALAMALNRGLRAERAILLGSPANAGKFAEGFAARFGISESVRLKMQERMEERYRMKWEDLSIPHFASKLELPALVVHDKQDRDVPWRSAHEIAAGWRGAEVLLTEKLGHHRILRSPDVVARAITFLKGESGDRATVPKAG